MDESVRLALLEDQSEEAMDLRFEIFMDELEAHAHPAFGDGKIPGSTRQRGS